MTQVHPTRQDWPGRPWPPPPEPLAVAVADSHCHLDIALDEERFGPALHVGDALDLARSVGIDRIVQIGCDVDGARWAVDVAKQYDSIVAGVALHPNEAPRLSEQGELNAAYDVIEELAANDCVRAIGETGLDYFRTGTDGHAVQEESFRWHIDLAKRTDKALVIHDRDAHDDVVRVLKSEGAPPTVVFHCFSGGVELADICAENGWVMSFAGTVTFNKNEHLREALSVAPLELLLVETDAPFLTPTPFRGRPNASYLIPHTLHGMSQVKGIHVDELCQSINETTTRVFGQW